MERVSAKFVPRLLGKDQKYNRLNVYYDLREQVGNDPQILSKVVTWDETWCYDYNPETKQASIQRKTPNSPQQKRPDRFDQMLKSSRLLFYANGIVHKEFVPSGQTVNQQFYLKVLKRLRFNVRKKTTRNEEQRRLVPSPRQCPCPHDLACAAVFGKKQHYGYPWSSLFTRPCAMRLFPVPSYERDEDQSELYSKTRFQPRTVKSNESIFYTEIITVFPKNHENTLILSVGRM